MPTFNITMPNLQHEIYDKMAPDLLEVFERVQANMQRTSSLRQTDAVRVQTAQTKIGSALNSIEFLCDCTVANCSIGAAKLLTDKIRMVFTRHTLTPEEIHADCDSDCDDDEDVCPHDELRYYMVNWAKHYNNARVRDQPYRNDKALQAARHAVICSLTLETDQAVVTNAIANYIKAISLLTDGLLQDTIDKLMTEASSPP
jgi:hypothetical protein